MKNIRKKIAAILCASMIFSGFGIAQASAIEFEDSNNSKTVIEKENLTVQDIIKSEFGENAVVHTTYKMNFWTTYEAYVLSEDGGIYSVIESKSPFDEEKCVGIKQIVSPKDCFEIELYDTDNMPASQIILAGTEAATITEMTNEELSNYILEKYGFDINFKRTDHRLNDGEIYNGFLKEYYDVLNLMDLRSQIYTNFSDKLSGVITENCEPAGFKVLYNAYSEDTSAALDSMKKIFASDLSFSVNPCIFGAPAESVSFTEEEKTVYSAAELEEMITKNNVYKELFDSAMNRTVMLAEGTLTYDEIKSERARINQKRIEAENAKYKDYIEIDSAFSCELNSNKYSETHISSGDINSDGKSDLSDLSEISLAILGDKSFTSEQKIAADVDGDGEMTLADLAKFKQYITKQIESLG